MVKEQKCVTIAEKSIELAWNAENVSMINKKINVSNVKKYLLNTNCVMVIYRNYANMIVTGVIFAPLLDI